MNTLSSNSSWEEQETGVLKQDGKLTAQVSLAESPVVDSGTAEIQGKTAEEVGIVKTGKRRLQDTILLHARNGTQIKLSRNPKASKQEDPRADESEDLDSSRAKRQRTDIVIHKFGRLFSQNII